MRLLFAFLMAGLLVGSDTVVAQTTYLQPGLPEYDLLDRLETKSGILSNELFLSAKPVSRNAAVQFLERITSDSTDSNMKLSGKDLFSIRRVFALNQEWTTGGSDFNAQKPLLAKLYRSPADLVQVNSPVFFLSLNPVVSLQALHERSSGKSETFINYALGAEARARFGGRIGLYAYVAHNSEGLPGFAQQWVDTYEALPGVGAFTSSISDGRAVHKYTLARGYADIALMKNYINLTVGYDRHFTGDGLRSLLLSDFAAPATFLRLNTRIWKLNYQNLYLELKPSEFGPAEASHMPHKYASIHTLTFNATKWLQVGLFESVVFNRYSRYEFRYMLPLIFYRAMERGLGSPDNVNIGFNFKAIAARKLQFYGQFMLDEFTAKELFGGRGYWANKFGLQLGAKYFDVAGINDLDLQAEVNLVRPYSYSHYDSLANYAHYNQPLAHPLGAGFAEVQGTINYRPLPRLYLSLRAMYYRQGLDTGRTNMGSDIFKGYATRSSNYNIELINGVPSTCLLGAFNASYELLPNLFFDLGVTRRVYKVDLAGMADYTTTYFYSGLRLNFIRRDYNFY